MRRAWPTILILLAGCASSHRDKAVEAGASTAVEHEAHGHHAHHAANDCESDDIGQEILDDVESGILSGIFQALFDSIFHRDG